jgi:peptidoglycan-associated lipoprotein
MKFSLLSFNLILFFFFSGCSKKVQPETTLNRDGENAIGTGSQTSGFNDGTDDLAGLGDPLRGDFDNFDPLSPRDTDLSAFENPDNVTRPFDPVLFGFDQYNINATERPNISEIAEFMKSNTGARLLIEGYCDWKGTPDYNKSLGDRRASTVKQYLVELGCEGNRIEVISLGDELAVPDANSEQSRLDRRATFVVSKGN